MILPTITTNALREFDEIIYRNQGNWTDFTVFKSHITSHITKAYRAGADDVRKIDENTSDGYHTFKELYEFRMIYNAALFNEWAAQEKYSVHKSKRHSDGLECFGGGWFVVVALLPTGQITNHYELKDWDLFDIPEREMAYSWDGHTAKDVADRLKAAIAILKGNLSDNKNGV